VGADRLVAYVLGEVDGRPKDPAWAAAICGIEAGVLRDLARRMAASRTLVTVSWSLQRARHGEQPLWMGIALAALLGQLGLSGRGFGHGYGSENHLGAPEHPFRLPTLPQGDNPVGTFIPVAQVVRMLEDPGGPLDHDGRRITLPDTRLVHWAGGNPFHHHQDLHRLRRALGRPDTVIVYEPYWTAMARHADVVFPATISLERDDIGAAGATATSSPCTRRVPPLGEARDDYATFSALAERLGVGDAFTEGRSPRQWMAHLWEGFRRKLATREVPVPAFDEFWAEGELVLPVRSEDHTFLERFRQDPDGRPLSTPSGRIELFSETIDAAGLHDCAGHPAWFAPDEGLGGERANRFPLHLIANQPSTRLHGQLDGGRHSQAAKVAGREALRIHSEDAAARGIADGDVVVVRNDRGSCYAGAVVTDAVRPRVVNLPTGAWFDPVDPSDPCTPCAAGNPNVLTADVGASGLSQGCTGQHVLVEVEPVAGELPPLRAHEPPDFVPRR
jgi:biotin/methionine sulfoxide reductase